MLWSEKYFGSKLYLGYLLITLMTCVILFSGCTLENTSQQTKEEAFFKDLKKNQEETYVYNPYVYELCIYNPTENSYTSCFGENEMLEYSIVLLNGNQTEQVVDLGEKEVESGILHNNCLYYSCYRSDSDLYDIYEYDISSKKERIIEM